MFEQKSNTIERGQVGIGTLIVFIALVLVAAIAAGVLINTAGFLQSQAESTGQESTEQVSNNINVFSATGTDSDGSDTIDTINLTVGKSPGSGSINLSSVEVQWVNGQSAVLQSDSSTTGFNIINIDGANDNILANSTDRAEITIETTGDASSLTGLGSGDSASLTITTASGSQTTVVLQAPEPIESPTEL